MERNRINERTAAGRALAKETLAATGKTHRGKASLGRPMGADPEVVRAWRSTNGKSIAETAKEFRISPATVKRYLAAA
jgi:putative DNA-invertase from lambdoid prophage Rac